MNGKWNVAKIEAEIAQIMAQTQTINLAPRWMPFVWASGLLIAAIGFTKYFLR